ncbi:sensor histidine kinase [Tunicatimonas pelagia]|uniref:sensor histidine kinase n=1 Tax=Tunicatimonas pelagia TaxID=931531 RepID=UPI002665AABD|nr:HAMP domain-containing sensor histidine kinase [Tunicatimonas pelagia]WKN41285.1 HAMP domain-containing sensor histidine kinase [Tunicatimonas pelagia]
MNFDTLSTFHKTLQVSKNLISANRKLTQETITNTRRGEQKTKNVAVSLRRLDYSRQNLSATINAPVNLEQDNLIKDQDAKTIAMHMLLHDVRSPIDNIVGLSQLIRQNSDLSDESLQLLDLLEKQAQKVQDRTKTHAIYHQLELGAYQPNQESFDLLQLLCKIQDNLQQKQFANPVEIWISGQPATLTQRCIIKTDLLLMELMLQNLIQNAVEASPSQARVRIDINCDSSTQQNELKQRENLSATSISIHNQGVIPASMQDHFFEKYVTYGKTRGTGLGTYIAMLITKSFGGQIAFTTSEERGTNLRVRLPQLLTISNVPVSELALPV